MVLRFSLYEYVNGSDSTWPHGHVELPDGYGSRDVIAALKDRDFLDWDADPDSFAIQEDGNCNIEVSDVASERPICILYRQWDWDEDK